MRSGYGSLGSRWVEWLDSKFYPEYGANWDDVMFRADIEARMGQNSIVLDYGAGRGNVSSMNLRGQCARVYGVDPDAAVLGNPFLDDANVLDLGSGKLPYPAEMFDLVVSDNVMEHIDSPVVVLDEIFRVLKPGGCLLFKTPNRCHYMPLIARITPLWFHRFYNRLRGRSEVDTFPTRYKLNSRNSIEGFAKRSGFEVRQVRIVEGRPEYLRISGFTYLMGLLYERMVNSSNVFEGFRCVIYCQLEKPEVAV